MPQNVKRKPKLVVTGMSPDRINTNTRIRTAVVNGAVESELFFSVQNLPIETVSLPGRIDCDIILAIGGGASDAVNFESLRRKANASDSLLVFWTHEDPYEFDLNRRIVAVADRFFTNERAAVPYYDSPTVSWLPLGADRAYDRQIRPPKERLYDLFFCGYGYPLRLHILEKIYPIIARNHSFALYGPNLQHLTGASGGARTLTTDQFADLSSRSLLTLNIGRDLAIANSTFNIVPQTPGPRTFDVALSGAPQIIFDDGVEIESFFDLNEEIYKFDSVEDIVFRLERLGREPETVVRVGTAAKRRVLAGHMYRNRIEELMASL